MYTNKKGKQKVHVILKKKIITRLIGEKTTFYLFVKNGSVRIYFEPR